MSKKLSYSQRLSVHYPTVQPDFDPIGFPKMVQKVVDGKVVNQIEFSVDDSSDNGYRFNDFALENLLAAGVDLKAMSFASQSLHAADLAVKQINSINS